MPIDIGGKKPPLGNCPVPGCGAPLKRVYGMIRCSRSTCDYVESRKEDALVYAAEQRLITEERNRGKGRLPDLGLRKIGRSNGDSDKFLKDMADPEKDPLDNGRVRNVRKATGDEAVDHVS